MTTRTPAPRGRRRRGATTVAAVATACALAAAACSSEVVGVLAEPPAAAPPAGVILAAEPAATAAAGSFTTSLRGEAPGWTQGSTALLERPDGDRWRILYELSATQVSTGTLTVKGGWTPSGAGPWQPLTTPLRFEVPEAATTGTYRLCRPLRGPQGDSELCTPLVVQQGTGG